MDPIDVILQKVCSRTSNDDVEQKLCGKSILSLCCQSIQKTFLGACSEMLATRSARKMLVAVHYIALKSRRLKLILLKNFRCV